MGFKCKAPEASGLDLQSLCPDGSLFFFLEINTLTLENSTSTLVRVFLNTCFDFLQWMDPQICNQSNFFENFILGLESKKSA